MDDDVEAAPIYRCNGKGGQPIIRPHGNYNLCMKWEPTWMESQQKQQAKSKAVPTSGSLVENPKSRECDEHMWFVARFRIEPVTASLTD